MSKNKDNKVILMSPEDIRQDPDQPRKYFDQEELESLAFTMESQGMINPIEIDEHNVIVTGERRWRAAQIAGLKEIPCIVWKNGTYKRFERQLAENLHHGELTGKEKDDAIVKLWETKDKDGKEIYGNFAELGRAVGLGKESISRVLYARGVRESVNEDYVLEVSTSDIHRTRGITDIETRKKIFKAMSENKIKSRDLDEVVRIAKQSEEILDKVLDEKIPLARATQAVETIAQIEEMGTKLTEQQKEALADNVAKDEAILDQYKSDVLKRVKKTLTTKPEPYKVKEPIGRDSPVNNIIKVKDEVLDNFRRYLGNCDANERQWARRTIITIRDELDTLIDMLEDV